MPSHLLQQYGPLRNESQNTPVPYGPLRHQRDDEYLRASGAGGCKGGDEEDRGDGAGEGRGEEARDEEDV